MRRIGSLTDPVLAKRFCDYLFTQSIDCILDVSTDSTGAGKICDLWVKDETHVPHAKQELQAFEESPNDARYDVSNDAEQIRQAKADEEIRRRKKVTKVTHSAPAPGGMGANMIGLPIRQQSIPVVIGVIVLSVIASFATGFGRPAKSNIPDQPSTEERVFTELSFVTYMDYWQTGDPYFSIKEGELWRLVTPTFLHGSTFHLAFNMLALYFLGSVIERLHGSVFIALLLTVSAILGTIIQIHLPPADQLPAFLSGIAGTPFSIGASGGVYGLFGYLWIRPLVTPSYPLHIPSSNISIMLAWIPLCIFFVPGVANGAHIGGLIAGMMIALLYASMSDRKTA